MDSPELFLLYFGEFGYEVYLWLGVCRWMVQSKDWAKVTACSFPGREALYAPFADAFVAHDFRVVPDTWKARGSSMPDKAVLQALVPDGAYAFMAHTLPLGGGRLHPPWTGRVVPHLYGERREEWAECIVFHGRDRWDVGGERNWPLHNYHRLAKTLRAIGVSNRFVSIGSRAQSVAVWDSVDMRGVDLSIVMDVLASARMIVGVSSGPIHLASQCACPQVVIIGYHNMDRLEARYGSDWNPFGASVRCVRSPEWNAPVQEVLVATVELLETTGENSDPEQGGQEPAGRRVPVLDAVAAGV